VIAIAVAGKGGDAVGGAIARRDHTESHLHGGRGVDRPIGSDGDGPRVVGRGQRSRGNGHLQRAVASAARRTYAQPASATGGGGGGGPAQSAAAGVGDRHALRRRVLAGGGLKRQQGGSHGEAGRRRQHGESHLHGGRGVGRPSGGDGDGTRIAAGRERSHADRHLQRGVAEAAGRTHAQPVPATVGGGSGCPNQTAATGVGNGYVLRRRAL